MTRDELGKLLDEKLSNVATKGDLEPLNKRLIGVDKRLASVEKRLTDVEKTMATKKDIGGLEERLKDHIHDEVTALYRHFRDEARIGERIERIERHLGLDVGPPT